MPDLAGHAEGHGHGHGHVRTPVEPIYMPCPCPIKHLKRHGSEAQHLFQRHVHSTHTQVAKGSGVPWVFAKRCNLTSITLSKVYYNPAEAGDAAGAPAPAKVHRGFEVTVAVIP